MAELILGARKLSVTVSFINIPFENTAIIIISERSAVISLQLRLIHSNSLST